MNRTKRLAVAIAAALSLGLIAAIAVTAQGGDGEWHVDLTSPSGEVYTPPTVTTTVTQPTTTTTTPPPGDGYPSLAPPFFRNGDYEPGCSTGQWGTVYEEGGGTVDVINGSAPQGNCFAKFTVPNGDSQRAEVGMSGIGPNPTLTWEQLLRVPSEANGGPDHGVLSQTKQSGGSSGGCFNGGLTWADDSDPNNLDFRTRSTCSADTHAYSVDPDVQLGEWGAFKAEVKFANNGYVKLWWEQPLGSGYVLVVNDPLEDTISDNSVSVKQREGMYLNDPVGHPSTAFHDGFHELCLSC